MKNPVRTIFYAFIEAITSLRQNILHLPLMKRTHYIVICLWLSTIVLSNVLSTYKSFCDNPSLALTEKESKEASDEKTDEKSDDANDENEKKSEKEKELLARKNLCAAMVNVKGSEKQATIPAQDETYPSSLYIFLPENPPEL